MKLTLKSNEFEYSVNLGTFKGIESHSDLERIAKEAVAHILEKFGDQQAVTANVNTVAVVEPMHDVLDEDPAPVVEKKYAAKS